MSQNPYSGYNPQQGGQLPAAPRRRSARSYEDQPVAGAPKQPHQQVPYQQNDAGYQRPQHQQTNAGYQQNTAGYHQGNAGYQRPPYQQNPAGHYQPQTAAYQRPVQQAYQNDQQQNVPVQNVVVNVNAPQNGSEESYFDGTLLQQVGYGILGALVTILTIGIGYPWVVCKLYGWQIKHTVINGHRLTFDGKATQLLGKWLLWMLLTLITFGIYGFWVGIALEKWRVKHTHFAE